MTDDALKPYPLTEDSLKHHFWVMNTHHFRGELPEPEFKIETDLDTEWGYVLPHVSGEDDMYYLAMGAEQPPFSQFIGNLLHLMVHMWQMQNGKKPGEARSYKKWARYFQTRGMTI